MSESQKNVGLAEKEYLALRDEIRQAIWSELDPLEEQIENEERIPNEIVLPILSRIGAFSLLVPRKYGGKGLSIRQYLPILAEFAKIQGGIRVIVHVHNSFAHALSEIGDEEQCAELLPGIATGEKSIAFALTEPNFGTGADLGSRAECKGDNYEINGEKWLITNSDIASHFIVLAKTTEKDTTAFIVPRESPGLTIERMPETMGAKGGEHGRVNLNAVEVPDTAILGSLDGGGPVLEQALEISRVFIAASSLGTSERALELSLKHAHSRVTFGKPIGARQAVQRYLAEMATDVYALRNLLADAADKWDRERRIPAEASMIKLFGLEAVGRVTDRALLIHGGVGYTRAHPIERLYRDARLNWLEEGTPTIQYAVAARELLDGYVFDDAFNTAVDKAGV